MAPNNGKQRTEVVNGRKRTAYVRPVAAGWHWEVWAFGAGCIASGTEVDERTATVCAELTLFAF